MQIVSGAYTGPQEVRYLFIDGEQLRRTAEDVGNEWFGKPVELDYTKLQGLHLKVFYYDCLPAKRASESEEQHVAKRAEKYAFFDELRELRGWHVSEGVARHRKKERQEQKEVDILIAVDMLTHTHRRNMHRLTFISGDQDFAPLIEAVVREGMYVELLYPEGRTSADLRNFADVARPMDIDFLMGVATDDFVRSNGLPTREYMYDSTPRGAQLQEEGFRDGSLVARLWKDQTGLHTLKQVDEVRGQYFTVRHPDLAKARRYFERTTGPLDWCPPPPPRTIASLVSKA
ncbi:UNVERIFIED_ORG: uncharacterized LabA/DUF88 family protein [Variovorax guangxiensis]